MRIILRMRIERAMRNFVERARARARTSATSDRKINDPRRNTVEIPHIAPRRLFYWLINGSCARDLRS